MYLGELIDTNVVGPLMIGADKRKDYYKGIKDMKQDKWSITKLEVQDLNLIGSILENCAKMEKEFNDQEKVKRIFKTGNLRTIPEMAKLEKDFKDAFKSKKNAAKIADSFDALVVGIDRKDKPKVIKGKYQNFIQEVAEAEI